MKKFSKVQDTTLLGNCFRLRQNLNLIVTALHIEAYHIHNYLILVCILEQACLHETYSVRMLLLFLNNSTCSQALSQITTTIYADELSVSLCLHLQEICISVIKCSWQNWKCHICLWSRQRSYKLSPLLAYYFCVLCRCYELHILPILC